MDENIFVIEKTSLRKRLYSHFYGVLVVKPHAIYFIPLVEITFKKWFKYGEADTLTPNKWAIEKAENELKNLGDYLQNLDNLILEKENSIKINKIDIEKCKVSTLMHYWLFNVKTKDKQYEFYPFETGILNSDDAPKIKSELRKFLKDNDYPIKSK